jgi:2-oxoglutarate ferredoxin oxidoreductase subunit alpha
MNNRFVIKITGAAGQGIKTSGLVIAKALKSAGFYTFGYTEYPSLIRGGHNVFQIDISTEKFASISNKLHVLLALDQNSIKLHADEIEDKGVLIYDEGTCSIQEDVVKDLESRKIEIVPLDLLKTAQSVGGTGIMKNTVTIGAMWAIFKLDLDILNKIITKFFNKSEQILDLNLKCVKAGFESVNTKENHFNIKPNSDPNIQNDIIIGGNEAISLGAISAGVRLYSSYPMTPASSILTYLSSNGIKQGMIVKQAEDEITAANMVIGAYYAGTRAMCGTSGGGFDLMSEAVSMSAMTETPFVCILAQRPGPATGVPTWTAQGDLNLALYSGHGEYPRIVLAAGDVDECYNLTTEAHNLAEKYQTPVILLTDKYLGESFFQTESFDETKVIIDRGNLITEKDNIDPTKMRYELTENGISDRWIPGQKINTYLSNSDEHTPKGYSTEDGVEISAMLDKRMRKLDTIKKSLPDPMIIGKNVSDSDLLVISWGSNKQTIIDVQNELAKEGVNITYMHNKYILPLNADTIREIVNKAKKVVIVEVNQTGQFANYLEQQTGLKFENRILKYDGRPFYFEELYINIKSYIE